MYSTHINRNTVSTTTKYEVVTDSNRAPSSWEKRRVGGGAMLLTLIDVDSDNNMHQSTGMPGHLQPKPCAQIHLDSILERSVVGGR